LIVKDAQDQVVFETGTFDENGDLRDYNSKHSTRPGSDPQLIAWNQVMADEPTRDDPNSTAPVKPVTFPWQASWVHDHLVPADDTEYLDLSPLPAGTYTAAVRLRFRSFPMYFLRALEGEENGNLDPDVKTRVGSDQRPHVGLKLLSLADGTLPLPVAELARHPDADLIARQQFRATRGYCSRL
jgi:hypothetical protein